MRLCAIEAMSDNLRASSVNWVRSVRGTSPVWGWTAASGALAVALLWTAPDNLDGFLGLIAAALLLNRIELSAGDRGKRVTCVGATWRFTVLGVADAAFCSRGHSGFACWAEVLAVLLGVSVASTGLILGIRRIGCRCSVAEGTAWLVATSWLTLPLWLPFQSLSARVGQGLIAIHPVFAMNTAVRPLGAWTEQPIPYQWTRLGQDFPYALPLCVWPMVALHTLIGMAGIRLHLKPRSAAGQGA